MSTKIIANLNEFISDKLKLIPASIIKPIIHWIKKAPIKINKLNEVRAFPALEIEKAIPTAGWVSDKKIELILSEYSDILTSDESETTKIDKLSKVKGMAKKTAETFVKQIPHFLRFLQDCNIESKLIITEKQNNIVIDESNPLYKKSVIMSGTRDKDIEHKLKEMGVVLGTSVTSKTFLVITPEPNSDSSKVVNAKKLNILILTPKQFKQNYNI